MSAGFTVRPSSSERIDLYWSETLWKLHSVAVWEDRDDLLERTVPHPETGIPLDSTKSGERRAKSAYSEESIWLSTNREKYQHIFGMLWMWRVLTSEQLAAMTGYEIVQVERWCRKMKRSGILEEGRNLSIRGKPIGPMLWRVSKSPAMYEALESFSNIEEISITGGRPARPSEFSDRHDLLTADLALRGIEFWPEEYQGTWIGEPLAPLSNVCETDINDQGSNSDAVFVRSDGLRIAFEMVNSQRKDAMARKVERWVQHILNARGDVVVVWLDIAAHGTGGVVPSVVEGVLSATPMGGNRRRILNSVATARWSEWFPRPYEPSDKFKRFEVRLATGDSSRGSVWRAASLWDRPLIGSPEGWSEVINYVNILHGTPVALKIPGYSPQVPWLQ